MRSCSEQECRAGDPQRFDFRMARPIVAEIDLAALAANLDRVRTCAPGAEVLAVVKANAYGHGLARVLPALAGGDGLALVEIDPAIALRESGYRRTVLLLEGFFEERELEPVSQHALAVAVHHGEQLRMLERAALP